ncbi:MAG: GNAT family N-acetyltransferase [Mesorhizobium sp.]
MNVYAAIDPDQSTRAGAAISVLRGRAAFEQLQPEWDRLFARAALPHQLFQSHRLLSAWAQSYDQDQEMIVVTAREHSALVAVLPLTMRQTMGIKRLQFMGMPIAQFGDMLVDPHCSAGTADAVWAHVAAIGADVMEARRVRADSAMWRFAEGGIVIERMEAPFARLAQRVSGDQPGPAYSGRDRSNLRRRQRRLEERGRLTLNIDPAADTVALAALAVDIKRRSLSKARILSPVVKARGFEAFFRKAAADPQSGLIVSTIDLDGKPIAIDLSFLCKGVAFGHVLAIEPAFQKDGAGNLLVHHVFARAAGAGAEVFDLLAPADAYKMHHADGVTKIESRVYPFTARGRLFALAFHGMAMPAARAMLRR